MDKLMQTLFFYIEDDLLDKYCDREDQGKRHRAREEAEDRLRDAMTAGQLELLEAYLRASFDAETADLEAMFLASYDLGASLQRRRVRSSAVPLRRTRRGRSNPSAGTPSPSRTAPGASGSESRSASDTARIRPPA